ncbi:hypothetical protein [Plasmodium yoelii yoelii]|uniref:Uncharacterized protein n=1 Tax=Plasmodium yoelii yoelii TaxID=73239 RepID=Q7RCC5_PLAYO|nr:hypothetical protein [Plasmodium yoelii yoelii]
MINHFKKNILLENYISTNCLKQKCVNGSLLFCSYSSKNNCNLYGVGGKTALLNFHRIRNSVGSIKKIGIHSYNKNNNGIKSSNNKERVNLFSEKDKKENPNKNEQGIIMYYPENSRFPYVTICVVLGMIGISSFFKTLIYNLKNCDNENDLISQVDKILNYLDNYFIIYNFEENKKNTEYKNDIFNIKYLTSQFFLNENILQCAVQMFTFFLASCFLEKHYGSLIYIGLFLSGTLFSNIVTTLFCDLIKTEKCDSIIKKQKTEHVFLNKKIQNLKKEALRNIDEINNKSEKIFFSLSSAFTDVFGIVLASTLYLLKILK